MASITLFSTIIIVMILANCGPTNSSVNDSDNGDQSPRRCGNIWMDPKYVCESYKCRAGGTCWGFLDLDSGYKSKEECLKIFKTKCTLNPPANKSNGFSQFGLIFVITLAIFVFFGAILANCIFGLSNSSLVIDNKPTP